MKHPLLLALLAAPLASSLFAEEQPMVLEPLVVTATRTPEPLDRTLASVTLIDRAEIERRQARSVPDLLRGVPGISIARNGGAGQTASVFLRGTNSDHVTILIDGIKVGSATTGTTPLEGLPIAQIDRVEVVRGPRSSLYGSEAIGGVIQIFTRRGGGPLSPRLSLGGGSYRTGSVSAGLSGGGEQGWFNLGASLERTDGINACNGRPIPFAGCGVIEPDRDGYRNLGVSLRAGYALGDWAEFDAHLLRSENRVDFDGSILAGNLARAEQQVLGATARLQPLTPWTLTLTAGRSWDKYRAFFEDSSAGIEDLFLDRFDTERDTLSLLNSLELGPEHLLTLGIDYQDERVDGTVRYLEDSRDNLGVFGEYQGGFGASDLKLSLRQDDNQQFGTHTTGNAAAGYAFHPNLRVSLSYGTAFKAPTFNELYFPDFGNPSLDPEQSRSLELGLAGTLPTGSQNPIRWGLSLYSTEIDDLIAFDATTLSAANIASARIRGIEATGATRIREWDLQASLTLLDPENRSDGANQGKLLPRRPEQTFQLDLDRQWQRWSTGATLFVAGRSFDDLANRDRLDGYGLLDLRAEYAWTPSLRLQARLENAFDEDYETAFLYNQPGRALYLTLRYEPAGPK